METFREAFTGCAWVRQHECILPSKIRSNASDGAREEGYLCRAANSTIQEGHGVEVGTGRPGRLSEANIRWRAMQWRCPVLATIEDEASCAAATEFVQRGIQIGSASPCRAPGPLATAIGWQSEDSNAVKTSGDTPHKSRQILTPPTSLLHDANASLSWPCRQLRLSLFSFVGSNSHPNPSKKAAPRWAHGNPSTALPLTTSKDWPRLDLQLDILTVRELVLAGANICVTSLASFVKSAGAMHNYLYG